MEFLKLFQTHQEYSEYLASSEYLRPNVSHCIQENEVHYTVPIDWSKEYFTIESLKDDNTIYLKASNSAVTKTVSASTDNGSTWVEYTSSTGGNGTTLATLNTGDKLLVKGENNTYATSYSNYNQVKSTKQFEAKGNIMSLLKGDNFKNDSDITGSTYTFTHLFSGCTSLIGAENLVLPATRLANDCYNCMFAGCTSLTTAPELPATTLEEGCYSSMFNGCTSLTTAPELPATTLANNCYGFMFYNCTSLTTAPVLPATTLAQSCYNTMFYGCTNLTTAPELPATTLALYCYENMFKYCTSLTTAPSVLPATTLAGWCYESMFQECTSLTTAPVLPATTLVSNCYTFMFSNCSSLNYIKAMFTTTPSNTYTKTWVSGVAATGTFIKNAAAEWNVSGVNGIPNGWTVETATA